MADAQRAAGLPAKLDSSDVAHAATGVSASTVQTAKAVKEKAPDVADRLRAGKLSVHGAAREAARRESQPARRTKSRAATPPEPSVAEPQPSSPPSEPPDVRAEDAGTGGGLCRWQRGASVGRIECTTHSR